MGYAMKHFKSWLLPWLLLALATLAPGAWGACSDSTSKIVINEYNIIGSNTATGTPFAELKIRDEQILANIRASSSYNPFSQGGGSQSWTLTAYRQNGQVFTKDLAAVFSGIASNSANNYCRSTTAQYIRIPFADNEVQDEADLVLRDNQGKIVDVLRAAMKKNSVPTTYDASVATELASCALCDKTTRSDTTCWSGTPVSPITQLPYDTDFAAGNANSQKNIQRRPDGQGIWKEATGSGNNSEDTLCASNDGIFQITKQASAYSVAAGNTLQYTLTVTNSSTETAMSNVSITDAIPAGLSFYPSGQTLSPSAGSASYGSGTLTWTIPSLAIGASASLAFSARVDDDTVAITNTAKATSSELSPAETQGSTTINALRVSVAPSIATLATGSNVTFTVTVQNQSAATLYEVLASLPLPAGLSYVSNTAPSQGSYGSSQWAIGTLAANGSASFTITAQATLAGTLTYTANVTTLNYPGSTFSASASVTVTGNASLDAYEPSVTDSAANTPANRRIWTRSHAGAGSNLCIHSGATATVSCALRVALIKADGTRDTTTAIATGDLTVSLEYCSDVSRSGATPACGGTWSALGGATASFDYAGQASGRVDVIFSGIAGAYEIVRVKMVSAALAKTAYSSDYFAIRPRQLVLSACDDDWGSAYGGSGCSGATRTLIASSATSAAYTHKAGRNFTLVASSGVASGYPGTGSGPDSLTASTTYPVAGTVNGTLTPGSWGASGGVLTSTTANYSEVGIIGATATDQNFSAIDLSDGTAANRDVAGSAYLGRFVPDHFVIDGTKSALVNRSDLVVATTPTTLAAGSTTLTASSGASLAAGDGIVLMGAGPGAAPLVTTVSAYNSGSGVLVLADATETALTSAQGIYRTAASAFTYIGEPMLLVTGLRAVNGTGNTTLNYAWIAGATSSTVSPDSWTALDPATGSSLGLAAANVNGSAITPLTGLAVTAPSAMGWQSGRAAVATTVYLPRNASPEGPYDGTRLGVFPKDQDGVTLASASLDLNGDNINNPGGQFNSSYERQLVAQTRLRYGRLSMSNAYGSEKLALPVPVVAQYWDSTLGWVTNALDSLTPLRSSSTASGDCTGAGSACNCFGGGTTCPAQSSACLTPRTFGTGTCPAGTPYSLTLSNPGGNMTTGSSVPGFSASTSGATLASGVGTVRMPAPTGGVTGSVDLGVQVPPWLQSVQGNPRATVTFGIYRQDGRIIYRRERY